MSFRFQIKDSKCFSTNISDDQFLKNSILIQNHGEISAFMHNI